MVKSIGSTTPSVSIIDFDKLEADREAGAFQNFALSEDVVSNLKNHDIDYLFPVQVNTFKPIHRGYNVIVKSRTGTGKTLGFCLPIVERLKTMDTASGKYPLCLILAPTRELAKQTFDTIQWLGGRQLSAMCLYGGSTFVQNQAQQIRKEKPIVVVGTPGRIKDHLEKKSLQFDNLAFVVLDECDRMLDMGFKDDVEAILNYAPYAAETTAGNRQSRPPPQTLIFSATMPHWVLNVVKKYCISSKTKTIDLVGNDTLQTSTSVEHYAIQCEFSEREHTIMNVLRVYCGPHRQAIVFCDTKKAADALCTSNLMHLDSHVLHGDIPQDKREMVMQGFKDGKYRVLVTTDVAARGLDIPNVDLVIVTAPPNDTDNYVHRSGRTGRAGRAGICICLYKSRQREELQHLENKTNIKFKRVPAPTSDDLKKANARDAFQSISTVSEDVRKAFLDSADTILATMGPRDALASALAIISSSEEIDTNASLLSGRSGFTTHHLTTTKPFQSCSVIVFFLRRAIGNSVQLDTRNHIGRILFTQDKLNAFFEVQSSLDDLLKKFWHNTPSLKMKVAESIQGYDLVHPDELFGQNGARANNNNSFGNKRPQRKPNGFSKFEEGNKRRRSWQGASTAKKQRF